MSIHIYGNIMAAGLFGFTFFGLPLNGFGNVEKPTIQKKSGVKVQKGALNDEKLALISDSTSQLEQSMIEPQEKPKDASYPIIRYVSEIENVNELVMIGGGKANGLLEGSLLHTYRQADHPVQGGAAVTWIPNGVIKVILLDESYAIAEIVEQESLQSRIFFPQYPNIMVGDWAVEMPVKLWRVTQIVPTEAILYDDLFIDPKGLPSTYELSERGKMRLRKSAVKLANRRLPLLMIEGHTDANGSSEANQIESYQRAMTIRQYMIQELGFDPSRLVAIGYGESDPADSSYVPGYRSHNRRIVLKVKSRRSK